jgi:peptide/nickel transport system ATP-binding protein
MTASPTTGSATSGPAATEPLLAASGLTKHFAMHDGAGTGRMRLPATARPVVHAVEDISLELPAAHVTAVVGESGSGKSTLARLLARLITPTSGKVLLNGREAPRGRKRRLDYARTVQMVLQDPFASLNPVHDVRYHLSRPLRVHGLARPGPDMDEKMAGLLERVALTPAETFLRKYPHELSGGQRQRVAIARALAVQPQVLLADEPVSMLDVSIRLGVLNLLGDLRDREKLAILYITHDIASARYLADKIIVMYAGQLIESGPAQAVTDQPAHPYTQLLLSAAPDPERATQPRLRGRGAPPSLVKPPSGCRFRTRCPHAMPVCAEKVPPAFPAGAGHTSACWLLDTGAEQPAAHAMPPARPDPGGQPAASAPDLGEES